MEQNKEKMIKEILKEKMEELDKLNLFFNINVDNKDLDTYRLWQDYAGITRFLMAYHNNDKETLNDYVNLRNHVNRLKGE